MPTQNVQKLLASLRKLYPDAKCGLDYGSPFELLIATILSAQCTDKRVNMVTPALFKKAGTPEKILSLGEKGLVSYIKTCGLYQAKAKNILATCQKLLAEFGGRIPENMEMLTKLPGVGRKTANVVLSNAFGVPAIAVDTHVFRVSRRLGLAKGKNPHQVELELQKALPKEDWSETHHLLIAHGRGLCSARNPQCGLCPLQRHCEFYLKEIGLKKPSKQRVQAKAPARSRLKSKSQLRHPGRA